MSRRDDHFRPMPSFGFGKYGKIATPPIREADRGLAMPASAIVARAIAAAIIVVAAPVAGSAQPTLKIFDAHLHYNQWPKAIDSSNDGTSGTAPSFGLTEG